MTTLQYYKNHREQIVCCGCFEDREKFDEALDEFQDGLGCWTFVETKIEETEEIPTCSSCLHEVEVI